MTHHPLSLLVGGSLVLLLVAPPCFAGAVTGFTGTDGFSAVPTARAHSILDTRINGVFPGDSLSEVLNILIGVADGVEVGLGGSLNVSQAGRTALDSVYPWVRAALPWGGPGLRTGFMVGSLLPGYNSSLEPEPGVTGLLDWTTGPLTSGFNLGYARGLSSGSHLVAANVNFSWALAGLACYEEQFVTWPVGGGATGGCRFSLGVPVGGGTTIDLTPAVLWTQTAAGVTWSFNPNLGLSLTF